MGNCCNYQLLACNLDCLTAPKQHKRPRPQALPTTTSWPGKRPLPDAGSDGDVDCNSLQLLALSQSYYQSSPSRHVWRKFRYSATQLPFGRYIRQCQGQVSHTLPIRSISFRPPSTYAKQLTLAGSVKPQNVCLWNQKSTSCSISTTFTGLQHKQGVHASSIISPHPHPNKKIHQATEGVMDKDI